ncbi:MAG TPA: protein kinase [Candidatus Eisenbacteria bacterium]|jgi:tetratricopeptide (TPR) repeat protein
MTSPSIPKRYEVRSLLGEGGSSRVYRVYDSIRDRELALKLVTPAESAFLRREFDTLRQIRHENLIQVFDWGALPSGEAYYTMEFIEGADWVRKMGEPQSADEVRRILTSLLRGLAHLHCHGEIHGDLKPGNILLGAGGVVKITDVGMGGSGGSAAGLSGTPGYAAPEVWEGAPADVRSDLYSVGVMAYEALTGKHPFEGRTVREVISGQLEGWVPSPGVHGVRVPVDLERVVMRALERQPGLRQGSADEFMEGFGVEDRIGEILGGKLVGREKEIAEIERLLFSEEPGTPTLLYVTGEPGIGKRALMEEVAQRAISRGARPVQLSLATDSTLAVQIRQLLGNAVTESGESPAGIAEELWASASDDSIIVWTTPSSDDADAMVGVFRPLARYLWALSLERSERRRVLLVALTTIPITQLESFESELILPPFSLVDIPGFVNGYLGGSRFERPLVSKINEISGGNGRALSAAILSLIKQHLIARRENCWFFRENQQIQSIQIPGILDPWSSAWDRLSENEKRTLVTLEILPSGVPSTQSELIFDRDLGPDLLAGLHAKGWIRLSGSRVKISSEGIRVVVRERAGEVLRERCALSLLALGDGPLSREERADLALAYQPDSGALREGLWASEEAAKRGDYRRAGSRLERCLGIVTETKDIKLAREVSLMLSEILHKAGDDKRAESYLREQFPWETEPDSGPLRASREYQLGVIFASLGRLDEAGVRFSSAIDLARGNPDPVLLLRSHAGLAEIEWRHRGGETRRAAIERIRKILELYEGTPGIDDELASLTYGLGAALVRTGERAEATRILERGLEFNCNDYWRMRICNALSTAAFYSSKVPESLDWITEAWDIAERSGYDSFKARILSNRGGILYALGRIREAVDQHALSSRWAVRMGSAFEFVAACSGAAINRILLAEYMEAIDMARHGRATAEALNDLGQMAKAMELEALTLFHIGSYAEAETLVRDAQRIVNDYGSLEVKPRLDWLLGRIASIQGDPEAARSFLAKAEKALLETLDWEDLPGVQIEMQRLNSKLDPNAAVGAIISLILNAESQGLVLIQIHGGVALAEIITENPYIDSASVLVPTMERALAYAETAGVLEAAWKMSYALGRLASQRGDVRAAQSRSTHALRIIREIAGRLNADDRKTYLGSPHVSSTLSAITPKAPVS